MWIYWWPVLATNCCMWTQTNFKPCRWHSLPARLVFYLPTLGLFGRFLRLKSTTTPSKWPDVEQNAWLSFLPSTNQQQKTTVLLQEIVKHAGGNAVCFITIFSSGESCAKAGTNAKAGVRWPVTSGTKLNQWTNEGVGVGFLRPHGWLQLVLSWSFPGRGRISARREKCRNGDWFISSWAKREKRGRTSIRHPCCHGQLMQNNFPCHLSFGF